MQLNMEMPSDFESQLFELINKSLAEIANEVDKFPPYLDKKQAASFCTVSTGTFDNWRKSYKIPTIRVDGSLIFDKKELVKFLKEHEK